jgi:hypothetical protein
LYRTFLFRLIGKKIKNKILNSIFNCYNIENNYSLQKKDPS